MKLENTLKMFVKSFSGNVMGIGIESQQITEALQKQEQISNCLLLDCYDTIGMQDTKKRGRNKKIPLKKLRKKWIIFFAIQVVLILIGDILFVIVFI